MDRFTSIGIFVAAVDEGSLAAAARRFGLSAAMAGKHLTGLEAQLGTRLLQRTTRRLSLTDAGTTYYAHCRGILDAFDEANREASDAQSSTRGLLRIAAPVTFGALHLGAVIARFMEKHPQVTVEVMLSDRYTDLLDIAADLAIRIGRLPDSGLVVRRIASCRMVMCASRAWLKHNGTPRTPDDLHRAQRLVFSEAVSAGDWTLIDTQGREHAISGAYRLSANNMQMLLAAALEGAGVAYGPMFVFGEHLARGDLVALLPDYRLSELPIQAVYPSSRHIPLKVRQFVEHLLDAFGNKAPWDIPPTVEHCGVGVA